MSRKIIVILLVLCPLRMSAEHLFEIGCLAGMAAYHAQSTYVSSVPFVHGGLLLSYSYQSPRVLGVRIGARLDNHRAGFMKTAYRDSYSVLDVEDAPMQVDYSIGLLREDYSVWSVGIPFQLAFSWGQVHLYIGPEVVFPFHSSWREHADMSELSVYYPMQDNRVYQSYPLAASRFFEEAQSGTQYFGKVQFRLSTELCYDIPVYSSRKVLSFLSVGVYFDYSFSSSLPEGSDRVSLLMLSDTREGFPLRRILTSVLMANRQGDRLVTDCHPFAVGVKFSYRFAPYNPVRSRSSTCRCSAYLW